MGYACVFLVRGPFDPLSGGEEEKEEKARERGAGLAAFLQRKDMVAF